jgi:hypothetical protein
MAASRHMDILRRPPDTPPNISLEEIKAEASGRLLFLVVSAAVGSPGLICAIGTD